MKNLATLRLFNSIQIDGKYKEFSSSSIISKRTIQNGYILHPNINPTDSLLKEVESVVGISGEKVNSSFHKSWSTIKGSSIESLVIQQIIHYITTYGFEEIGIYREDTVYIPYEVLELPEIQKDIPLVIVKAMTSQEILNNIIRLGSGIALSKETLSDIMIIVKDNSYNSIFVEKINNRELKSLLYDFYKLIPSNPEEFLRYLINKLTGESLVIKNRYLIDKILQSDGKLLDTLIKDAPDDLGSIFFRFKPLFLAMKKISGNKTYFNNLRRKAPELHKPLSEDYMNSVTYRVKNSYLNLDILQEKLKKTNIFRKIRLAYALTYRLNSPESITYRIRNGRGWSSKFNWPEGLEGLTKETLDIVLNSIVTDINQNVEGKTIYIPKNIHYALPVTEKQFTGNFPTGTCISVKEDLIVGIHWFDTHRRIDLDLSVVGPSGKVGWDSDYRTVRKDVLFSGDMTAAGAPNGASELFYLKENHAEPRILFTNFYNFQKGDEVEVKILVAHERPENFELNYMIDVNNIIGSATININRKQNILGLVVSADGENLVYFANISIGNSITSYSKNKYTTHTRQYLVSKLVSSIDFREILTMSGAKIVNTKPNDDESYINLSPHALDKNTIIDLIKP